MFKKLWLALLLLQFALFLGCVPSGDESGSPPDSGAADMVASCRDAPAATAGYRLSAANIKTFFAAAQAELGTSKYNCKDWVRHIYTSVFSTVSIPSTKSNNYEWNSSSSVAQLAQYRATWNTHLSEAQSVAAGKSWTTSVTATFSDYQLVGLWPTSSSSASKLKATLTSKTTGKSISATGAYGGALSWSSGTTGLLPGADSYTLTVANSGSSTLSFNVAVVSHDRLKSDFETARMGDVFQGYLSITMVKNPHSWVAACDKMDTSGTCNVKTAGMNTIDSNWCTGGCNTVKEHNITLANLITWTTGASDLGFTVYGITP